ncbi:unnamed protein product [Effrenium voratum]|nr:unnamed protein product [Effrenium voratum]
MDADDCEGKTQDPGKRNEPPSTVSAPVPERAKCDDTFELDCGGNGDCGLRSLAAAYGMEQGKDADSVKEKAAKLAASLRAKIADAARTKKLFAREWAPDPSWTEEHALPGPSVG